MTMLKCITHDFVGYGMELIIFYLFFNIFVPLKKDGKKIYLASIGGFLGIVCLCKFLQIEDADIIYFLYIFSVCSIVFECRWYHKVFIIIMEFCIGIIIANIVISFFAMILNKDFQCVYHKVFLADVLTVIKLIVVSCINLLYRKLSVTDNNKLFGNKIGLFQVIFLTGLPSMSLVLLMNNFNQTMKMPESKQPVGIIIAIAICLFVFNITSILLVMKNSENAYYRQINKRIQKQLADELKHYEGLEQVSKETMKLKHDMKNHTLCIKELIEVEQLEEARVYIGEVVGRLEELDYPVRTGNPIADIIFKEKSKQAAAKQIQFKVLGHFLPRDNIASIDRCTVLANAIDNAIEACEKIEDHTKRYIYIDLFYSKGYTFITVKNSVNENVALVNGKIKTSKKDTQYHGYGLENIRQAVEKYNGILDLGCDKQEFILQATFYTPNATS